MADPLIELSKLLSLLLRHQPGLIGLQLDANGWANLDDLLTRLNAWPDLRPDIAPVTREMLLQVVASSDKQRFALDACAQHIRANQGHSLPVELLLQPQTPPEVLYHGTATRFLPSIWQLGLHPASRQHVHLSADAATARSVGARHGQPVVLRIAAGRMQCEGHVFYRSANGVWLTAAVAPSYLSSHDEA